MRTKHQDYEDQNTEGAGFVTGLFLGAVIGACAALFYAPKSGEQTRQDLKDLADQQKDNLRDQWERTKEKASGVVNTAKEKLDSFGEQAKGKVDTYADKAKGQIDHLADGAKSTVDKFQPHGENPEGQMGGFNS